MLTTGSPQLLTVLVFIILSIRILINLTFLWSSLELVIRSFIYHLKNYFVIKSRG